jgi:hypothetical protein
VGNQRAWRATHPLGWKVLAEAGIEDRSPLRMLGEKGVLDPLAERVIAALYARRSDR